VNLFERVRNILLRPRDEWPRIAAEAATPQSLYLGYIMLLAAIGPIVMLLTFGGFLAEFGLRVAIAAYVNSLVAVAVLALIVDLLAPSFGGGKDYIGALKLTAYSFTSVWVGEIALLIPWLGWLVVLAAAIYGFYLFFLGAPILNKCSADRAALFTIVVLLCAIVLMYLVRLIIYSIGFGPGMGTPGMGMIR
jgi:Yip1 domain